MADRAAGARHGRTPLGRPAGHGLCCAVGQSFTVSMLIALPAAYLALFELAEDYPGGDLGLLLLFIAPLLLLPFALGARTWAANGRTALRWAGKAAAHYVAYYLTPIVLLASLPVPVLASPADDAGFPDSPPGLYLQAAGIIALFIGAPVLAALLMVAPWASRGRNARLPLALLANLAPAFLLLLGGLPVVLVIGAHIVFACRIMPAAVTPQPSRPDPAGQHHPAHQDPP